MEPWEQMAAGDVFRARALVEQHQAKLIRGGVDARGRGLRVDELDAIIEILNESLAHLDPHAEIGWHP